MGERLSVDVLVIGGGPAGSILAARLAQLGHEVALLEREAFPRPRLGESLTPGVLPLLRLTGADEPVERAGFPSVESVLVDWDDGPRDRSDEGAHGLLVDRGQFDLLLLEHARALGVGVLQPAVPAERRHDGERWRLRVDAEGGSVSVDASFLAAAGGRSGALPSRRTPTGARTLALHAYWRGFPPPLRPCIQALADAWCWGVPLPGGTVDILVFVDPGRLRSNGASVEACYHELVNVSVFGEGAVWAERVGAVRAADATPYLDTECVTETAIRVGDAGLSLDPISSSGVQKAVQTALAGAVVVNTVLRRPGAAEAARRFYRDSLERASARHQTWAAARYAAAAATRTGQFWTSRAGGSDVPAEAAPRGTAAPFGADARLEVSHRVEFVELPCIAGEFVELKTAVAHPRLDEPVAYLGSWELAPLLRRVPAGLTSGELVRAWSELVPREAGLAISDWLGRNGILVAAGSVGSTEQPKSTGAGFAVSGADKERL